MLQAALKTHGRKAGAIGNYELSTVAVAKEMSLNAAIAAVFLN